MEDAFYNYLIGSISTDSTHLSTASNANQYNPGRGPLKHRKLRGARDSLNSRMKIGRPGSRRYRHWENEFFLVKNLSETESEYESEYSDKDEPFLPGYGAFAVLFEEENAVKWEPFVDITEEEQRILLKIEELTRISQEEESTSAIWSAAERFGSLHRRARKTLRRNKYSKILHSLDLVVSAFARGEEIDFAPEYMRTPDVIGAEESQGTLDQQLIVFAFGDKFRRHLLHCLCEFYDLVSYSTNVGEDRLTVVKKRNEDYDNQICSVVDYLVGVDCEDEEEEGPLDYGLECDLLGEVL